MFGPGVNSPEYVILPPYPRTSLRPFRSLTYFSHDDDDDDDDDIDVGDQATQLQDGASPIINVVSRTVDSANYPPQKTMPAGPTEVKNRKENAIGSLLAGAAEDGGRASMTLTPGLLDQSDPAYWDGLAEMMRTPSRCGVVERSYFSVHFVILCPFWRYGVATSTRGV